MRQFFLGCTASLCLALLGGCAAKYQVAPDETTVKAVVQRWTQENNRALVWDVDDLGIVRAAGLNERLERARTLPAALDALITTAESARRGLARAAGEAWPLPVLTCVYSNVVTVTYLRSAALPCSPSRPADNQR